jgi:transglutaminase-like putative cysteine protease
MRQSEFSELLRRACALRLWHACCAGAFLALVIRGTASETPTAQVAPPSSWVKPQFFNQQASAALVDAGSDEHALLLERQINAHENETFVHVVRQILTTAGVQKEANLSIDFNPGYQTLTLHWARIWRGGQHLERLDTNQVKVVQPEREMDQFILNGKKSAILVLDDVRVGDIIDYAYSIKGENPVLGGHFSADVPVQIEQPAERLLTRVLMPTGRRLYAKAHGCSVQPAVVPGKETTEYDWDLRQMPGIALEDDLPIWYDPEPWVQLSDFKTWADVNQWALALFKVGSPISPELARQIAAWKRLPDRESQILSALTFVQDDVRYFGIEIGASTEKPGDPSTVFSRRFGDCKDKSLLFVTILRALGIEAYPVLVNATLERGIADWQPSADAFDHCIAVARCDGQAYWVDPTMNYQRGLLATHYLPAYDCGLVISPYTTSLTPIPHTTGLPQTSTTEYFLIRGVNEASDLKVVTTAEGRDAEDLRELFATKKRSDIEKGYTHFYSDFYSGIKMASPITVADDPQQNKFETTEFYSIDNMWSAADKTQNYRCEFYAGRIATMLKKPMDTDRKSPLGILFPEHFFLRTEVTLPQAWPALADRKSVDDPAFAFQKAYQSTGNRLVMEYDYKAQADWVSTDRVDEYLQRINQASQLLGYSLTWR